MNPLTTRLKLIAARLSAAKAALTGESLNLRGVVYASLDGVEWTELGNNLITDRFRIHVAGVLARPSADHGPVTVTYEDATGYASSDDVFPAYITMGTGTTAARATDTALASPLLIGGSAPQYPVTIIRFHTDPDSYTDAPIHAGFHAQVPVGEVYDDLGDTVTVTELGLWDWEGRLLARKVIPGGLSYKPDASLWLRWQIRT